MSFFDLFKKKPAPVVAPPGIVAPSNREGCNFSQTELVAGLLKVPRDQRGDDWHRDFYQHVATAGFAGSTPQVLTGPDGFPYFILKTPGQGEPFEPFCLRQMKDDFLLEKGWGVVFNPAPDQSADWVFTYGAILNLHLKGEFVSEVDDGGAPPQKDEQVMIAQPSDSYLPIPARAALRNFLQRQGIKKPMIFLLTAMNSGKPVRKLAFNIHPENYKAPGELEYLMQLVGWYLPNDYILIPLPKKSELAAGFHPL